MVRRRSGRFGCLIALLVFFGPAILMAYFLDSPEWLLIVPAGTIAGFLIFLVIGGAIFGSKRKVTPEQFADELERHLLGTEGPTDWDRMTSVTVADERLERIQWELTRFDSLSQEKDKEELRALIAAIRRGELPEVIPPKHLTYPKR